MLIVPRGAEPRSGSERGKQGHRVREGRAEGGNQGEHLLVYPYGVIDAVVTDITKDAVEKDSAMDEKKALASR